MIKRIFIAMALAITLPTLAHADKEWLQDDSAQISMRLAAKTGGMDQPWLNDPIVNDEEEDWKELSGASQSSKLPLTIRQIDELERGRPPPGKSILDSIDSSSHARNVDCMKAFGHARFCRCLGDNLPVFQPFELYVAIVANPKVNLDLVYLDMKAEDKRRIVERVIEVREQCVASTIEQK